MRVMAAVVAFVEGERVDVSQVCREAKVSRKTFYKWVRRYRAEGEAGLVERSRRPHRFPRQVPGELEELVVRLRKELADAGMDHGATTIHWHLGRDRSLVVAVPSVATIHRILVRRGLVTPTPKKRPKSSWRRFEAPAPNEWWQIDSIDWVTAAGPVKVFSIIDDHSRLVVACRAVAEATSEQAWITFSQASRQWGLPAGVLSDNGLCFSGKLRGFEVLFEANLRDAGVRPITGRPYHPQTTGKVERFQQTLRRWLRRQRLAADRAELQTQLDTFAQLYNHQRPHQGIGRVTPIERWHASAPATAAARALTHPEPAPRTATISVNDAGVVRIDTYAINVGVKWVGCTASVVLDARYATIFIDGQLVRHLKLDPTRRYQPSGKLRGGPRQRPLPS